VAEADLKRMEEAMSGACTMEVAAFDEFAGLFQDEGASEAGGFTAGCAGPGGLVSQRPNHVLGNPVMLVCPRTSCMLFATMLTS